jgi:hypothetical protein
MDKFKLWYIMHQVEITWFLIGWLVLAGVHELQRGDLIGALIDFGLAYINYWFTRK